MRFILAIFLSQNFASPALLAAYLKIAGARQRRIFSINGRPPELLRLLQAGAYSNFEVQTHHPQ